MKKNIHLLLNILFFSNIQNAMEYDSAYKTETLALNETLIENRYDLSADKC